MAKDPASGATVDGAFTYNLAAGTILAVGTHKLLIDSTLIDPATYSIASKEVTINFLAPLQEIPQITAAVQDLVTSSALTQGEGNALKANSTQLSKILMLKIHRQQLMNLMLSLIR